MNLHYLPNGDSFVIDPEKEANPISARTLKKQYLLTLNLFDLAKDKMWTAEVVRKLATGMVKVVAEDGKTRATKVVLIERLAALVTEEREVLRLTADTVVSNAETTLNDCSFSTDALNTAIESFTGNDLVDHIVGMINRKGYEISTTVKTVIPDVVKVLRANYKQSDCDDVISALHGRYRTARMLVHKNTNDGVAEKCNDREGTNWTALYNGMSEIFERVETATWKELSLALAFATGRRCAEVHGIKTKLTYIDNDHVMFEGQLKTKSRDEVEPYAIPVLYDASKVIRARERLIELGKGLLTPAEVKNKVAKAVSTELPPHLVKLKKVANITQYKDFRDSYAAKVSEMKPEGVSQNAYLSQIMGHGEGDLVTASTYDKRYIKYA